MSKLVSHVAGATAALVMCAALVHCFSSGPSNTSFTHPYTGAQGSNSNDTTDSNGTTSQDSNQDLLTGATEGTGSATFNGTVHGTTFSPTVAVFDAYGLSPNAPQNLVIYLSNNGNFCDALVKNGNVLASSSYAAISALTVDANQAASGTVPGNYTIVTSDTLASEQTPGNYVSFDFFALDNLCEQSLADSYYPAVGGSMTLTALSTVSSAPVATGNMSLTVGSQHDAVSLSFQAAPCPGLYNAVSNANGTFGCQ